jgi:hypothetical protein
MPGKTRFLENSYRRRGFVAALADFAARRFGFFAVSGSPCPPRSRPRGKPTPGARDASSCRNASTLFRWIIQPCPGMRVPLPLGPGLVLVVGQAANGARGASADGVHHLSNRHVPRERAHHCDHSSNRIVQPLQIKPSEPFAPGPDLHRIGCRGQCSSGGGGSRGFVY